MALTDTEQRFILHWGEMGTRWGINRTVAQIHALLYLSERAMNAEDIAAVLTVARSNVSNSLHELQGWGIVKVVHVLGDRRDHFECAMDVWEMFQTILDERKRREIDPTLAMLRELKELDSGSGKKNQYTRERVGEVHDLLESMSTWYTQITALPRPALKGFVKAGAKIQKTLAGLGSK